jgi:hypothetical protein
LQKNYSNYTTNFLIFVYIYHRLSIIELKSIYLIGIIAALTIIGASIGSFVFIEATAQNITSNATNSSNMTAGANTTMTGQSGNISGIENPGM